MPSTLSDNAHLQGIPAVYIVGKLRRFMSWICYAQRAKLKPNNVNGQLSFWTCGGNLKLSVAAATKQHKYENVTKTKTETETEKNRDHAKTTQI